MDTATNPGGYTWYDSQNLMGAGTGALFDLHVLALPYMSAGQSIVQELTCTYPTTSAGITLIRTYYPPTGWTIWVRQATATPPQRYVLQLADGWVRVNAAEYWRTQEGLVIVTFRIARSGGAEISAAQHPIATLPEGYRPVGYAAHVAASTMTAVPAVVWVGDNGVIYASAAQDIPGSSDPAPGNWPGFVATMVFCAN